MYFQKYAYVKRTFRRHKLYVMDLRRQVQTGLRPCMKEDATRLFAGFVLRISGLIAYLWFVRMNANYKR